MKNNNKKKDLIKIKIFFIVLFSVFIYIAVKSSICCFGEAYIQSWRHMLLWWLVIIQNILLLILILGLKI